MGGIAAIGSGISGLMNIIGTGSTANTMLQAEMLGEQFQQQEQDTVLQMGLSQAQNEQLQTNMIGQNVSSMFDLQQKTEQTFFKTTKQIAQGWTQALGGSGGG